MSSDPSVLRNEAVYSTPNQFEYDLVKCGGITGDLNASIAERLIAILAGVLALAKASAPRSSGFRFLVGTWGAASSGWAENLNVLRLFDRRRGPFFALCGLLTHQFYYLNSSAVFV